MTGPAAQSCAALSDRLPDTLAGAKRRATTPRSPFTAAWGDPAVVLRCGIAEPPGLVGGDIAPIQVNGVTWLQHYGGRTIEWTVIDRAAFIELAVPKSVEDHSGFLVGLAGPIKATLPARALQPPYADQ